MRKIISVFLSIFLLMSSVSGCNSSIKNNGYITQGQLLHMISEAFGMYTYNQKEPYFTNVSADNKYFSDVQIAKEWEVIDNASGTFDTEAAATNNFLAVTLVNAAGLTGNGTVTIVNGTDVDEPDKIAVAIENGLFILDSKNEFDPDARVDYNSASIALAKAVYIWSNKSYDKPVADYTAKEDVVDLSKSEIDQASVTFDAIQNTLTIPEKYAGNLKPGEIYIMPQIQGVSLTKEAVRIEAIEFKEGYAQITNSNEELALEDVFDSVLIQDTVKPDLSQVEVLDGNGNPIDNNATASNMTDINQHGQYSSLVYINNDISTAQNTALSRKISFTYDDFDISGEITEDSIIFSVSGDSSNAEKTAKTSVETSFEIKDIKLTTDFDYSFFTLHSALVKLDYNTELKLKASFSEKEVGVFAPSWSNGNGKFSTNLKRAILKDQNGSGAKSIKIASLKIPTGVPGLYAGLDVKLILSISGSATVVVTKSNTNGLEYKNNNIRIIKTSSTDLEAAVNAQVEGTIYLGASVNLLGITLAGAGFEGGLGVSFLMKAYMVDDENRLNDELDGENGSVIEAYLSNPSNISIAEAPGIHIDICSDVTTYGILRFKVDLNNALGKVLQGMKIKKGDGKEFNYSWDILNKNNAKISQFHIEEGNRVDNCTRKYNTEDKEEPSVTALPSVTAEPFVTSAASDEDTSEADFNSYDNEMQQMLDISPFFIHLSPGASAKISILHLPDGYDESNIKYKTEDSSIADVDGYGNVTGVSVGSTVITVYTDDGKYKMECAVTVSPDIIISNENL